MQKVYSTDDLFMNYYLVKVLYNYIYLKKLFIYLDY